MRGIAVAAVLALGCAPDEIGARAQPILNGAPDDASTAVVAIVQNVGACGAPNLDCGCSGVLVAPRVVLTAAHCLENAPPSALEAFFGSRIDGPGTRIAAVEGVVHPQYDKATHAYDVAALVLASPAPATAVPIRIEPVAVGDEVRVLGFGLDDPKTGRTGVRRAGTAVVTEVSELELRIAAKPAMTCHGDSGGPVFVGDGLVGITTWGDAPCLSFGAAMRVDRIADFVAPIVARAKDPLTQPPFEPELCGRTCKATADCPTNTTCVEGQCSFRGLLGYRLGAACSTTSACSEACLDTPIGCRCIERCTAPTPAPPPAGDDGSCTFGRSPGSPLWLVLLLVLARRRR